MRVVLLSNDPVRLNFALTALRAAGIGCVLLDESMSVLEGSIGAIPRRIMVEDGDLAEARQVLAALGVEPSDG